MTTDLVTAAGTGLAGLPLTREEVEASAAHMAREYAAATAEMRRAMDALRAAGERVQAAFSRADSDAVSSYNRFDIDVVYDGHRVYGYDAGRDRYADLFRQMRRKAWEMLADHLGIKNVMSVKKREEFERLMKDGDPPEITEASVVGVILSLVDQARDFARDAAREVFDILRPSQHQHAEKFKTNSAFRVGRRVILQCRVERGWGAKTFRPTYYREKELIAIDGVFSLLDGKGVLRHERKTPLVQAILDSPDGRGETDYFSFRCFANGNLHITFKRLDLVKQLNGLGAGEYVLGADGDGSD